MFKALSFLRVIMLSITFRSKSTMYFYMYIH
nr:MAG TPA: hypothetical protein [Caudoviricetes sp.]